MLTFNFHRILQARAISRPHKFLISHGISPSYATRLVKNCIRSIDVVNLEKLCLALNCTPNDLLQWTPPKDLDNADNHPLSALKHEENNIVLALKSLPPGKIKEAEALLFALAEKKE